MEHLKPLSEITDEHLLEAIKKVFIAIPEAFRQKPEWRINRYEFPGESIKLTCIGEPYVVWFYFEGEPIFKAINDYTGRPIPYFYEEGADDLLHKKGYQLPYEI